MKLNISDWESFCASDIFFLYNGSGITKEEIEGMNYSEMRNRKKTIRMNPT